MLLIIAPSNDVHMRCVARELQRRDAKFTVVDAGVLGAAAQLTFTTGPHGIRRWATPDGVVDLEAVETVWHRRCYLPMAPPDFAPLERRFAEREWREGLSGVLSSLPARFVNEPSAEQRAVKPLQLAVAERCGLRVPDTLITNDRREVESFVERHRGSVVHKALTPPRKRFLPTQVWRDEDRTQLDQLAHAPTIFQERISGRRELRVTVVGEQLFAAEFAPRSVDGRLDLECQYVPRVLPAALAARVRRLMRALNLVYSTIDFKLTDEGEFVFLELNPGGQYLYIEILTEMPITASLVDLLCADAGTLGAGMPAAREFECSDGPSSKTGEMR